MLQEESRALGRSMQIQTTEGDGKMLGCKFIRCNLDDLKFYSFKIISNSS